MEYADSRKAELLGLRERGFGAVWIHPCCLLILFFAVPHDWMKPIFLYSLGAVGAFSSVLRGMLIWRWNHWIEDSATLRPTCWRLAWMMSSLSTAASMGLIFALCLGASGDVKTTIGVCLAGMSAAGMVNNVPSWPLVVMFVATTLVPSICAELLRSNKADAGLAFLSTFFMAFLLSQGRNLNRQFWQSYHLRLSLLQRTKKMEDAVGLAERQQEMIQLAQNAGNLALWDWNLVTGEAQCSEQWFVFHGITGRRNPITLNDWLVTMHPEDRDGATIRVTEALEQDFQYSYDYRVVMDDGSIRWVNSRGRIFQATDGTYLRMLGASVDIHSRVINERALHDQADVLRETISHRDLQAEILNRTVEELKIAKADAEHALLAKGTFLAHMSHEIRTPMNGVIGMADILLTTHMTAEQIDYTETIRSSGESLLCVINDILDLSKIEAGKLRVEQIPFSLYEVAEQCIDLLSEEAAKKSLLLRLDVDPDVPLLMLGDPARLRQVLLNLVGNAIKFTLAGSVDVRAAVLHQGAGKYTLQIEVQDSGVGISEEAQGKLFQAFAQADSTTTRQFGGTGLGLFISRGLVELMGGEIRITSFAGVGSTFTITIPCGIPVDQGVGAASSLEFYGRRVLVLEQSPQDRKIIEQSLRRSGMSVDWANDREHLLTLIGCSPYFFNAILISVDAVETAEVEFAQAVRRLAARTAIAMVAARRSPDDHTLAARAGVSLLLRKPLRSTALASGLKGILRLQDPMATLQFPNIDGLSAQRKNLRGRVLVAEDNLVNQKVARGLLTRMNYDVEVVGDGLAALHAVLANSYDVVLMDANMPVMDGLAATREIRKAMGGRKLPIIALTASALASDRDRCFDAGMDDYLSKPVQVAELRRVLDRWVPGSMEPVELVH